MNEPTPTSTAALAFEVAARVERRRGPDPATVYLARLAPGSRRTMRGALATIAAICVPDAEPPPEPEAFPWERLRAEHAKAIRAALAERYKYSTVNKTLSACAACSARRGSSGSWRPTTTTAPRPCAR